MKHIAWAFKSNGWRSSGIIIFALFASSAASLNAQVSSWNNTTDNWSTAASWTPTGAPTSSSATSLIFGGTGGTTYVSTNDIGAGFQFNNLTFDSDATVSETIGGGSLIAVANGSTLPTITQNNTGIFNVTTSIQLNDTLTVNGTGTGLVRLGTSAGGNLTGTGGLIMAGTGTLQLAGSNTFSGGLTVKSGTVLLATPGLANSPGTGAITLGDTSGSANASLFTANTFGINNAINVAGGSTGNTLTLGNSGGTGRYSGLITLAHDVVIANGTASNGLTINGGVTGTGNVTFSNASSAATAMTISVVAVNNTGNITFSNSGTGTLTVAATAPLNNTGSITNNGTGAGSVFIASAIGSTVSSLTQNSATSTLILSGANTFTGTTTISQGTLQLGNGSTTGSLSASGTIVDNGTLAFNRSNAVVQGTDFSSSAITGTGGLFKAGASSLTLNAANTYSGNTSVIAGTLILANGNAIQNSTVATGGTGIVFSSVVGSHAFTFGGLSGSTNLALTDQASNNVALTVGGNNESTTYSGVLSGGGSLVRAGTGTMTLSGANTFTGGTTQNSGSNLVVNGSIGADRLSGSAHLSGTGTVGAVLLNGGNNTVSSSGTLTTGGITVNDGNSGNIIGGGTIGGNIALSAAGSGARLTGISTGLTSVTTGATLSGTGTIKPTTASVVTGLTVNGGKIIAGDGNTFTSLTIDTSSAGAGSTAASFTGATLQFDLQAGGTNSSSIDLLGTGIVNFNNDDSNLISIVDPLGLTSGTTYTLFQGSGTTTYSGLTFSGTQIIGGLSMDSLFLTDNPGSILELIGNNIVLEVNTVPEPNTWVMMLGGVALLAFPLRRRQHCSRRS